ncbi:MAG: hypothetical protein UH080_07720 [Ruminococcus sp.]|nr:hypothetical protein [Ruminococcus sp.]
MRKQKFIKTTLYCIIWIFLIISFVLDILISNNLFKSYIVLNKDFVSAIFSGILTFSTLSQTVLSIIVSVIDTKNYGLKLKDILSFRASPINFIHYILFSTCLILLSIFALVFNLCTFISTIAIISILYTNIASIIVFKIISDAEMGKKIIFSEIKNKNYKLLSNYIVGWIDEYKEAIINNNKLSIDMYSEILKECTTNTDTSIIKNSLQNLFETACKNHSVADSIDLTFRAIGLSTCMLDVCKKSIKSIEFCEEKDIVKMNLPLAIDSIISDNFTLWYSDKIELIYFYIKAVIYSNMTKINKLELLNRMIDKITNLTNDETGSIKSEVIYKIIINDIIGSNNEIDVELYEILMKCIYCNNLFNRNNTLISTIARILRALYFYSNLSMTLFTKEKMSRIENIAKKRIFIDFLTDASLRSWVIVLREELLNFYLQDAFKSNDLDISIDDLNSIILCLENGLQQLEIWTKENKLHFSLWFYFAFGSFSNEFPIHECTKAIPDYIDISEIKSIFLNEFRNDSTDLSDSCLTHIQTLTEYFGSISSYITPEKVQTTYTIIKSITEE